MRDSFEYFPRLDFINEEPRDLVMSEINDLESSQSKRVNKKKLRDMISFGDLTCDVCSIIDSTSQSKAGWFLRSSKSPGIEIHVPVGWYLSLTRRPNGTPSTTRHVKTEKDIAPFISVRMPIRKKKKKKKKKKEKNIRE
ncbi:hypothetical protein V1478_015774 [Vespula squamosa]|uniref:Uncharacterized protein n=1 Tax=Vespula squamosa TaxID=30214 RepID=A0ABD2A1T9_VESSQ